MNNETIEFKNNVFKDIFDKNITELLEVRVRAENEHPSDVIGDMRLIINQLRRALKQFATQIDNDRINKRYSRNTLKYSDYCRICDTKFSETSKK